jgi:nickel-dependent lactate racemase
MPTWKFCLPGQPPFDDSAEMAEAVSEGVASRLKMYNSDCNEKDGFDYFGETSRKTPVWINKHLSGRDHVILTGTIVHHYFSGYGGGRKAVLPGCAAMETIRHNHSFMMDPHAGLGKTVGQSRVPGPDGRRGPVGQGQEYFSCLTPCWTPTTVS